MCIMILFFSLIILNVQLIRGTESAFEISNTSVDDGHNGFPSAVYNPPKPDFSAPGRRISETKCLEYMWEIKTAVDRKNRSVECEAENKKKLPPGIENPHRTQFPHLGAVGWEKSDGIWSFQCGCGLISPQFVLSVAHCPNTKFEGKEAKIIRFGVKNILQVTDENSSPIDIKIDKIILHPNFNRLKNYYDIALMKLEKEVGFTELVHPACVWPKDDLSELGPTATSTGWGNREDHDDIARGELLAAVVKLMDSKECSEIGEKLYNTRWSTLKEHQLCADKLDGELDVCEMRMSGPLQVKIPLPGVYTDYNLYYLIGLASFGNGVCSGAHLDVYTRVSSFLDWIEAEVWP